MSTHQSENKRLDGTTRARFHDLLYGDLISREHGHPNDESYLLTNPRNNGNSLRATIHKDAVSDSPLTAGDEVTQHYFEQFGIVIVDLNPSED